ncbi:MAG: efflux RND transporter periplasmic adaptor subunit [Chloroflexi bacterium]|nr:efflux RND transporter periplasmic adaptor subunit [Chloroflexota bacterium]
MKRTILYVILGIITVATMVGVSACGARQPEEEETRSAVVERGTMLVSVSASGSIKAEARVDLTFELPGEVFEVPVKVGDRVVAGDVLAQLDSGQMALQVQQARATLAMVEAQLIQLEAGAQPEDIAAAEANLRAVESQVDAAAANRDELVAGASEAQIAAVEAQVAAMDLQHRVALLAYDRVVAETENKEKRERAYYDVWTGEQAMAAAQLQLDELLAGADANAVRAVQANVAAAEAQRDAAQAQLDLALAGATREQLTDVQAQVAQTEAALALAQLSLDKVTLYAPFDGVVAAVNVIPGEMASAAMPTVTLLDISQFRMAVNVDEIDVGQLVVGQVVQVTLDALSDVEITGVVERIAPAATISGGVVYYAIVIELDPTDEPIRADMTANATIIVEELTDVLLIPTWVVRVDDTGQKYVNQQAGDEIVRTDVTLGIRHEGYAQVLAGLSEGDEAIWVQESGFGFGHP